MKSRDMTTEEAIYYDKIRLANVAMMKAELARIKRRTIYLKFRLFRINVMRFILKIARKTLERLLPP